jgi:hypothetical protein
MEMASNPRVTLAGDPHWLQIIERQGQQLGLLHRMGADLTPTPAGRGVA